VETYRQDKPGSEPVLTSNPAPPSCRVCSRLSEVMAIVEAVVRTRDEARAALEQLHAEGQMK
jgi:hypothetical protein